MLACVCVCVRISHARIRLHHTDRQTRTHIQGSPKSVADAPQHGVAKQKRNNKNSKQIQQADTSKQAQTTQIHAKQQATTALLQGKHIYTMMREHRHKWPVMRG